jgi:hypothetical protein
VPVASARKRASRGSYVVTENVARRSGTLPAHVGCPKAFGAAIHRQGLTVRDAC